MAFSGPPFPPLSYDEEYDSEAEEERMRELEEELYSRVHYATDLDAAQERGDVEQVEVSDKISRDLANEPDSESGYVSPATKSPASPIDVIELEESDENDQTNPNPGQSTNDVNQAQEPVEIDSDSDDDGIQVLSTPTVMKRSRNYEESVKVVTVSSESSDSSDDDYDVIVEPQPKIRKVENEKEVAVLKNVCDNPRRGKLVVEPANKSPLNKTPVNKTLKYVAHQSDSDSSDSSLSSSEVDDSSLMINMFDRDKPKHNLPQEEEEWDLAKVLGCTPAHWEEEDNAEPTVVCNGWTQEMYDFYNKPDPNLRNFSLKKILASMPENPAESITAPEDKPGYNRRRSSGRFGRYFMGEHSNKRCNNCWEFGHISRECPEPVKEPVCIMCAVRGHTKDNCPTSFCLGCGTKNRPYQNYDCDICKKDRKLRCLTCGGPGHVSYNCPDNWRRYHATLPGDEGIVVPEEDDHKPLKEITCINCGKTGHYTHQCTRIRSVRMGGHAPVTHVCSYDDFVPEASQSKRQRKRELKEAKSLFRSNSGGRRSNQMDKNSVSPFVPRFLQSNEAEVDEGDSLANQLLGEVSTSDNWRAKKRQKRAELKQLRRSCNSDESKSPFRPNNNKRRSLDNGHATPVSNNKHSLHAQSFKQRGFVPRSLKGKSPKSHIRFEKEKTDSMMSPFPRKQQRQDENRYHQRPEEKRGKKKGKFGKKPGDPVTCPKSMKALLGSMKSGIKRCGSKALARKAQSELNELRYEHPSTNSVPKKERKKFQAILQSLEAAKRP